MLEDFQTGTASMARKRHLASIARGLICFCLMAQIEVQEIQEVQWIQIRPIRLIRGRKEEPILWRTAFQAAFVVCYLYRGRCPRLLFGSALQAPECLWGPLCGRKNPQDRGGADTQAAPVGRVLTWPDDKRMGGI